MRPYNDRRRCDGRPTSGDRSHALVHIGHFVTTIPNLENRIRNVSERAIPDHSVDDSDGYSNRFDRESNHSVVDPERHHVDLDLEGFWIDLVYRNPSDASHRVLQLMAGLFGHVRLSLQGLSSRASPAQSDHASDLGGIADDPGRYEFLSKCDST